jgi:hypothetical protein
MDFDWNSDAEVEKIFYPDDYYFELGDAFSPVSSLGLLCSLIQLMSSNSISPADFLNLFSLMKLFPRHS